MVYGGYVFKLVKDVVVRAAKGYSRDNCGQKAAAISYFGLLSMFPLVLFAVSLIAIIAPQSSLRDQVVNAVLDNIPLGQQGPNDVRSALKDVSGAESDAVGVFGVIALAWAASGLFGSLRSSLTDIFDPSTNAPLILRKAIDLSLVLGVAILFFGSLVLTGALNYAASNEKDIPVIGQLARDSSFIVAPLRVLIPFAISCAAFFFVYWLVPASGIHRRRDLLIGAAVAAAGFEIVKHGFAFYLSHFTNYAVIFGPIGAIIAFLFWLYLSANILLFGAEFAVALEKERERRATPQLIVIGARPGPTGMKKAFIDVRNAFLKRTPRRQRL